jgi:sterol desaturase/sphingolipid hydroxylase (fatty acid hydroxylase superfamily)
VTISATLNAAFDTFYVVALATEIGASRFGLIKTRYDYKDAAVNFATALGVLVQSFVAVALLLAIYGFAYQHRIFTFSPTDWWSWVVLFFADDLAYYGFHRLSHRVRWWWASHVTHHSSQRYNLSVALRQPWTAEIVGSNWLPWVPLAFLGFPPWMIVLQHSINLAYQYWIHIEWLRRLPPWFEAVMNTPSHHRVHHGANPRYLDRNYGGILIIWDRLFGSFQPELDEEPSRYGLVHDLETHNVFVVEFGELGAIFRDLFAARSLREAFGVVFGPPGWKSGDTSDAIRQAWAQQEETA